MALKEFAVPENHVLSFKKAGVPLKSVPFKPIERLIERVAEGTRSAEKPPSAVWMNVMCLVWMNVMCLAWMNVMCLVWNLKCRVPFWAV